ncbi:MAG: hypothetical protein ACLFVU_14970 [Phycisphaerae bacterium]
MATATRKEMDALRKDLDDLRSDIKNLSRAVSSDGNEKFHEWGGRLSERLHSKADQVRDGYESAKDQCHEAAEKTREAVSHRPLTLMAAALGAGALLGGLLFGRR